MQEPNKQIEIRGSGGGKSGSASSFYRQSDTISSTSEARLLLALSAGPIEGLKEETHLGASIFFDETPLVDASTGEANFSEVSWAFTDGASDQTPIELKGFNAVETTNSVKAVLRHGDSRSQSGAGDTAVVTLRFPQGLVRRNDAGIFGSSVKIAIEQRVGTTWRRLLTRKIAEKQASLFEIQFMVELEGVGTGSGNKTIRVLRITENRDDDSEVSDRVEWLSVTWQRWDRLSYPGVSLLALRIGAESFGGRLPRLSVALRGRRIRIPNNYDPETRTLSGSWAGGFKTGFSNNPAWVLYDLLIDKVFGLGLEPHLIESYDLYDIARYADELVDDGSGNGTQEARFLFDGVIARRVSAAQLTSQICAMMRVSFFWSGGRLRFIQDRPSEAVLWLTNEHVLDGVFVYTGPSGETAYSHAMVSFTDHSNARGISVEAESNSYILSRYGYKAKEVALLGCTRRSQARRHARWLLESSALSLHGISWQASLDHLAENPIRPGDVVRINDKLRMESHAHAGRVVALVEENEVLSITSTLDIEASEATLDYETAPQIPQKRKGVVTPPIADSGRWEKGVAVALTELEQNGKTLLKITPKSGVWSRPPTEGGAFLLYTQATQTPQTTGEDYRIIAVREIETHRLEITAIRYDANLYDRIETGIKVDTPVASSLASLLPSGALPQPKNLVLTESRITSDSSGARDIYAGWTMPQDARIVRWRLTATDEAGASIEEEASRSPIILRQLAPGEWQFSLVALDRSGIASEPLTGAFTIAEALISGDAIAPGSITAEKIKEGTITAEKIKDGSITATQIKEGTITASKVKIDDTTLGTSGDSLTLKAVPANLIGGVLRSTNYTEGEAGFRIDTSGTAEFNDAKIRGELKGTRIVSSILVASHLTTPTQSLAEYNYERRAAPLTDDENELEHDEPPPPEGQYHFLALERPRPLWYCARRLVRDNDTAADFSCDGLAPAPISVANSRTLRIGPMIIARDAPSPLLGDRGDIVVAANSPHGNTGGADGYNEYYSRFVSRRPRFRILCSYEVADGSHPWGRHITGGGVAIRVRTQSGRVIGESSTASVTSSWRITDEDITTTRALGVRVIKGDFESDSSVIMARKVHKHSSGSLHYTKRLLVTVTPQVLFVHHADDSAKEGLIVELIFNFTGGVSRSALMNSFYHTLKIKGTTHD